MVPNLPEPCSVPTRFLKLAKDVISVTFSVMCNSAFEEGVFPDKNKSPKVIPNDKMGSAKDISNYRPISLLSTFSKIMEKLMATRLTKFLELHSNTRTNMVSELDFQLLTLGQHYWDNK